MITLASRVFRTLLPFIPSSLRFLGSELGLRWPSCWTSPAQMLGYASAVSLSPIWCAFAVGESIPFLDSSTELWLLSRHTCSSTSYVSSYEPALFAHFLASLGPHGVTPPPFLPTLTFSSRAVPLLGFLGFFGVRQSYSCVGVDRQDDYSADSSASLAQCSFVGVYFPNFAIFALVSDHLRNFSFYSWASLLVLPFLAPPAYSPLSLS